MPRMTALHMLRSTISQPLCTLRVRRHRRLTQHSLPGDSLGLTWAGLAPADRASFAWRLQSFDQLVGAGEQHRRDSRPSALAVVRLINNSNFVGNCTGRSADFSPFRMRSM